MGRQRDPKREQAYQMWKDSPGIKLKDIAEQLGVSDAQIRKWKNQDNWDAKPRVTKPEKKGNVTNKAKGNSTIKGHVAKNVPARSPITIPIENEESDDDGLTIKTRIFIGEYLRDFNATRAAMAAGYSKKTAYSIGWELLRKPEIQTAIKKYTEGIMSDVGLNAQRILMEYMKIAFADITDFIDFGKEELTVKNKKGEVQKDEHGAPITVMVNRLLLRESTEIDGTLISEVKEGRDGVSIKLHDKTKALEVLTKYIDLLPDKHKRMIEEEKIKIDRERLELEKLKSSGGENEAPEDDGFIEALKGKVSEVWNDDE